MRRKNMSKNVSRAIGCMLRQCRKRKGMRQTVLAQKSGFAQPMLSRLENGGVEPMLSTLVKVADVLDVEVILVFQEGRRAERLYLSGP